MADITINRLQQLPNDMLKRYEDMGDGTHAEVISTTVTIGALSAGDNNIGNVDLASATPTGTNTIGATKDAGPNWTSAYLHTVSADATGAVDLTAAPTAGQKIVIDDIVFSTDTAMNFIFEEETSGTDVLKIFCAANSTVQITPRGQIKLATADKKLRGDASVSGNVAITVVYHSES